MSKKVWIFFGERIQLVQLYCIVTVCIQKPY